MKRFLLTLALLLAPVAASAQCNGVFPNNTLCGNVSGSSNLPRPVANNVLTGVPGGINPQIQFNNNGVFGGLTDAAVTARIAIFNSGASGAVPASGGGTTNFLRADGTFAAPTGAAVTYTAPGTGGTSQSLTTRLSRTLYLTDYGAACDGTTDDHTALQNMINEAQTLGSRTTAVINCVTKNVASSLVITSPFTLTGTGMTIALLLCDPAITCIDKQMGVGTVGMYIGNFSIQYTSTGNSGTAAIKQRSTAGHQVIYDQFENMYVFFAFNGFDLDQANSYRITNIEFNTLGNNGMNLANSAFVDAGNGIISSVQCVSVQACIQWSSGGGVHMNNLVVSGVAVNALVIALASGASTSDIWVNNSQLEGISGAAILITRQGTTGNLKKVRVSNTEFEAHIAVQVPTDATGAWLSDLSLTNNQWLGNGVSGDSLYLIDSTTNFTISGGTATSSFTNSVMVQTGSAASNGYVGNIVRSGSFTAMAFAQADSVTLDWALPGITLAQVPTGARNGSRIFIQDGTPTTTPCTAAGAGATAFKRAGALSCF